MTQNETRCHYRHLVKVNFKNMLIYNTADYKLSENCQIWLSFSLYRFNFVVWLRQTFFERNYVIPSFIFDFISSYRSSRVTIIPTNKQDAEEKDILKNCRSKRYTSLPQNSKQWSSSVLMYWKKKKWKHSLLTNLFKIMVTLMILGLNIFTGKLADVLIKWWME